MANLPLGHALNLEYCSPGYIFEIMASKISHFSYIGDSILGKNVNIGAGTVTCNYDGIQKNSTFIGDDVFIGAGTMLIAPINISSNSRTGAGSVVNSDVDKNQTVVGIPAKPIKLNES